MRPTFGYVLLLVTALIVGCSGDRAAQQQAIPQYAPQRAGTALAARIRRSARRASAIVTKVTRHGVVIYRLTRTRKPDTIYTPQPGPGPFYPGDTVEYSVESNPAVCTNQTWNIVSPSPPYDVNWPLPSDAKAGITPSSTTIPIAQSGSVVVSITFAADTPPSDGTGYEYETDFNYVESGTTSLQQPCPANEVDGMYLLTDISAPPSPPSQDVNAAYGDDFYVPGDTPDQRVTAARAPSTLSAQGVSPQVIGLPGLQPSAHGCVAYSDVAPQSFAEDDEQSPLYFYAYAFCAPATHLLHFDFVIHSYAYNSRTVEVGKPTLLSNLHCNTFATFLGYRLCRITPHAVPLPLKRSQIETFEGSRTTDDPAEPVLQATWLDFNHIPHIIAGSVSPQNFLNDRAIRYPVIAARQYLYPADVVPFPASSPALVDCTKTTGNPADARCKKGSSSFRNQVIASYPVLPPGFVPYSATSATTYEAHHIQESSWGGTNLVSNGILLPNGVTWPDGTLQVNVHQKFTNWWGNFSLPSSRATSAPIAIVSPDPNDT